MKLATQMGPIHDLHQSSLYTYGKDVVMVGVFAAGLTFEAPVLLVASIGLAILRGTKFLMDRVAPESLWTYTLTKAVVSGLMVSISIVALSAISGWSFSVLSAGILMAPTVFELFGEISLYLIYSPSKAQILEEICLRIAHWDPAVVKEAEVALRSLAEEGYAPAYFWASLRCNSKRARAYIDKGVAAKELDCLSIDLFEKASEGFEQLCHQTGDSHVKAKAKELGLSFLYDDALKEDRITLYAFLRSRLGEFEETEVDDEKGRELIRKEVRNAYLQEVFHKLKGYADRGSRAAWHLLVTEADPKVVLDYAVREYEKGTDVGIYVYAMLLLEGIVAQGRYILEVDHEKAVELFLRLAKKGHQASMNAICELYMEGYDDVRLTEDLMIELRRKTQLDFPVPRSTFTEPDHTGTLDSFVEGLEHEGDEDTLVAAALRRLVGRVAATMDERS